MPETKYSYNKTCSFDRLEQEISDSDITIALDRMESPSSGVTDIWFKNSLSTDEQTLLSSIVTAHSNIPLPQNEASLVTIKEISNETGGIKSSPKFAPDNWAQQMFEFEFKTSKLNSIHEKDYTNQDIGWASAKFYKSVSGVETQITGDDLNDTFLSSNCVRTDILWMPDIDYMIKSGFISQLEIPTENIYVWALGADLDAVYGGPQLTFLEGGLNLAFFDKNALAGMDGVSGTLLNYSHPLLGPGAGTNRIRFVIRHPVGAQHRLQAVFNIFMEV